MKALLAILFLLPAVLMAGPAESKAEVRKAALDRALATVDSLLPVAEAGKVETVVVEKKWQGERDAKLKAEKERDEARLALKGALKKVATFKFVISVVGAIAVLVILLNVAVFFVPWPWSLVAPFVGAGVAFGLIYLLL